MSLGSICKFVTVLFGVLFFTAVASAQREQLWLARYCTNEAGFQVHLPFEETTIPDDCSAMHESLLNNFGFDTLRTWMMRRYGDNVFNRERTDRRFIPFMVPHQRRSPRGWVNANWAGVYGPRFTETYEYAGAILSGSVQPKCQPHHWGAPSLRRRARRHGWERLDCGNTANDYWRVPARSSRAQ